MPQDIGVVSLAAASAPVAAPTAAVESDALRISVPASSDPLRPSWCACRVARSRTGTWPATSSATSASQRPDPTALAPAPRADRVTSPRICAQLTAVLAGLTAPGR